MRTYILHSSLPAYHFEPASFRQLKVLKFFGHDISKPPSKGDCSSIVAEIFSNPENKHLWAAYVYTTGDESYLSSDLLPHDKSILANVEIPEDWSRSHGGSRISYKGAEELINELLKDGSPFDDPLPEINISRTTFCFTGAFNFGTREQCQEAVTSRGA